MRHFGDGMRVGTVVAACLLGSACAPEPDLEPLFRLPVFADLDALGRAIVDAVPDDCQTVSDSVGPMQEALPQGWRWVLAREIGPCGDGVVGSVRVSLRCRYTWWVPRAPSTIDRCDNARWAIEADGFELREAGSPTFAMDGEMRAGGSADPNAMRSAGWSADVRIEDPGGRFLRALSLPGGTLAATWSGEYRDNLGSVARVDGEVTFASGELEAESRVDLGWWWVGTTGTAHSDTRMTLRQDGEERVFEVVDPEEDAQDVFPVLEEGRVVGEFGAGMPGPYRFVDGTLEGHDWGFLHPPRLEDTLGSTPPRL